VGTWFADCHSEDWNDAITTTTCTRSEMYTLDKVYFGSDCSMHMRDEEYYSSFTVGQDTGI